MTAFETAVPVRWSDMDAFGHVNNARVVTLLEEARTEMLFAPGEQAVADGLGAGIVVATLSVRYRRPLHYTGEPVPAKIWVTETRAASFTLAYRLADRTGAPAVLAETMLVPYDLEAERPRRLTDGEKTFLARYTEGGGEGG